MFSSGFGSVLGFDTEYRLVDGVGSVGVQFPRLQRVIWSHNAKHRFFHVEMNRNEREIFSRNDPLIASLKKHFGFRRTRRIRSAFDRQPYSKTRDNYNIYQP